MSENHPPPEQNSVPRELEIIPATFFRINARDLMARVKYRGERFVIETFGHPMAVVISYEDYLLVRHHLPNIEKRPTAIDESRPARDDSPEPREC